MKRMLCMTLTFAVSSALAADVTYKEPPADTSMIRVEGGTTTVAGLEAYSHLTHYWSFDDAENYLTDSTGTLTFGKMPGSTTITHETAEGAKLGAGAVTVNAGLQVPKNVIAGQTFTVAFWLRPNDKTNTGATGTASQGTIFYVGEVCTKEIADEKRLLLGYGNDGKTMFFWKTGNSKVNFSHTTVPGTWEHWAITRNSENTVTVYLNGKSLGSTTYENVFGENDKLVFGNGWHYDGGTKPIGGGTFDEIQIFDRALTDGELKIFADYSSPVDFSAGWDIAADGTLDIFGRKPLTALQGYGVAKTMEGTRLEASSNAWFAGSVQSPAFTFAGGATVTQTLSGTNGWTGATTVESGTLKIATTPVELFGDALVAWYPFDDPANPGRDFSPRGNNLSANTGFTYEALPAEGPLAGSGLMMSMTNCTAATSGMKSGSRLNGFAAANNSFTVAFWMRDDKGHDNEGPLSFSNAHGFRRNGSDTYAYWGDTSGPMIKTQGGNVWGTGEWHHWVMMFDAVAAEEGGKDCYFLFKDGVLNNASPNWNKTPSYTNHATQAFYLGRGMNGNVDNILEAALDEVVVLKTANTNDVAKLYDFRRAAAPTPKEATGVLPTGTTLTVEEGATLKLSGGNETVRKLTGKGTIDLSGNSTLTVTRRIDFDGKVIGGEITDGRPGIIMIVR